MAPGTAVVAVISSTAAGSSARSRSAGRHPPARQSVRRASRRARSRSDFARIHSFSRSGLVVQLIIAGFTPDQDNYGLSQAGF